MLIITQIPLLFKEQRISVAVGCSALNHTPLLNAHKSLREEEVVERGWLWGNSVFQTQQGSCTCKFIAVVAAWTNPKHNPMVEGGVVRKAHPQLRSSWQLKLLSKEREPVCFKTIAPGKLALLQWMSPHPEVNCTGWAKKEIEQEIGEEC